MERVAAGPLLTVACGLAAALPVIVSTIRGVAEGWFPFGDQAVIATRAYDTLTAHAPLVGQFSSSSGVAGHPVYSPGPLLYWLLALPAHFGPPASIAATVGAANAASIIGAVWLARRRGGRPLMLATAVVLALMCRSFASEILHDPWNPSAGLLPLTLLVFTCWSIACGEARLLPLAVLLASFAIQCHLAYVFASVGLLIVAIVGLAVARPRGARDGEPRAEDRGLPERVPPNETASKEATDAGSPKSRLRPLRLGLPRRPVLASTLVALAVVAICWAAPVADQVGHRPGNLSALASTATAQRTSFGASAGWHAVVRAVGVPPWWLIDPRTPWDRQSDVLTAPGAARAASAIVILAALLAAAAVAIRRRRGDVAAAAAVALVLCAALAGVAAATPTARVLRSTLGYTMWWGSVAGASTWLLLGWSVLTLLPLSRTRARTSALARIVPAAAASVALAAGAAVAASGAPDLHRSYYSPLRTLGARLDVAIPSGRTIWLNGTPGVTAVMRAGLRYSLRRHGVRALGIGADRLGGWYDLDHRRHALAVYVQQDGARFPHVGWFQLTRLEYTDAGARHTLVVWLSPNARRRALSWARG